MLKAETLKASTPNLFEEYPLTNPSILANNSGSPGTKSLLSTSHLLGNLLEEKYAPSFSVKDCLHDFIQRDPQLFTTVLPRGLTKIRPTGHKRGRSPHAQSQKLFLQRGPTARRIIGVAALQIFHIWVKRVSILSTSKRKN